jgi:hypothetical protein
MATGLLFNPFARLLFMEANKQLNKRASAKRARWATYTGRPFPRSATDTRPDPGTLDDRDAELG